MHINFNCFVRLASTIFQHYVAADSAPENFASLKRLHGLMPYFVLKGILKISNPVAMIRGFLDLFLAQPFGGRSLLQRFGNIYDVYITIWIDKTTLECLLALY